MKDLAILPTKDEFPQMDRLAGARAIDDGLC